MRQSILYIIFLVIGHFAIATSFEVTPTSKYMTVSFNQPSNVFGYDSTYTIGAFVKRADTLLCVGFVPTVYKPSILNMTVYGKDEVYEGAVDGEELIFIGISIYPGPQKCEIVLYPTISNEKVTVNYQSNSSKGLDGWENHNITLNYELTNICIEGSFLVSPVVDFPDIPQYGISKYSFTPNGLAFNPSTGDIYVKEDTSREGIYTISLEVITGTSSISMNTEQYCIQTPSFDIRLVEEIQEDFLIDDYILQNNPQSCDGTEGALVLNTEDFPFENSSFQIEKNGQIETYLFQETYNFIEGDYVIKNIIDQYGCEHLIDYSFTIERNGDCGEDYVLMPLAENAPHEIIFDQEGEIKIVNQNGIVIKKLIAPTTWNGETEDGSLVDMGIYFIYNENEFVKNLHVYR